MNRKIFTAAILLLAATTTLGQTNGGTGKGLDSLDEQQVMANLASTGQTALLERDFINFKIPENERQQVMTLILLKQLQNPIGLNVAGRRALAMKVADGMNGLLAKATDPDVLMEQANELFSYGIVPTVTQLEYFGENPLTQSQLKPVAETAKKMYVRVGELADIKINALANTIKQNNVAQILPQLQKLKQTKLFGEYSNNMATYALCISLPKTDPKRKSAAEATIKYLKQFDDPKSTVQPTIRVQIGKLQLVAGSFADAKATFDTVSGLKDIVPTPDAGQQNDARYFGIVSEISARKLNDAAKDIPELENWETQNYLPRLPNPSDQAAVRAALSMLKFRLYSAQSDLTNDANEKKKENDQAIGVLATLVAEQPALKDLVFDQLIGRIPDKPDLTTLNPFVLIALEEQGVAEVQKKPDEQADEKKMKRAIDAAKELLTRKGQPNVTDAALMRASQYIAYAYQRMHMDKESAAAFMDFAETYPNDRAKATDAMDHATELVGELHKKDPTDPDTRKLYDRFLPLAINPPFNRKVFAFSYAGLLQEEHKFADAVTYYRQVPESDKRYPKAQFLAMLSLTQELVPTLTGDDRKAVVTQILDLAKTMDTLLASAKTDEDKKLYLGWVISATEIAADLTRRELKDPAQSLKILDGFEEKITASPDADKAHIEALHLRIDDYMDMGKIDEATKTLVALMSVNQELGQGLMFTVLKTVDNDMETAKATKDTPELKKLSQDRAQLSGFIVDWATKSKDPKVQAALPNYQLYDADSKRDAAVLLDNPTARKAGLEEALKEYKELNHKNPDEPYAQLGIGLTSYDLGQYQQAVNFLAPLMDPSKGVLHPTKTVTEAGGIEKTVEDPDYWDANYKRVRSLVELYKQNPKDPIDQQYLSDADTFLKEQKIIYGKKVGGEAYHEAFDQLEKEIAGMLKK
jgi:hypothetical protein